MYALRDHGVLWCPVSLSCFLSYEAELSLPPYCAGQLTGAVATTNAYFPLSQFSELDTS